MDFEDLWRVLKPQIERNNLEIWNQLWRDVVSKEFIQAQKDAAKALPSELVKNSTIQLNPKQVMEYYHEHGLELVKTLTETDKNAFKDLLEKNFHKDFDEFKEILDNSFVVDESRAKTIWNTEKHTAYTTGYDRFVRDLAEKSKTKLTKTWHHSGNPHPREEHLAMDGITVGIDELFPNGEDVPTGINCGCWLEYRNAEESEEPEEEEPET